jgi:hypothetical protein
MMKKGHPGLQDHSVLCPEREKKCFMFLMFSVFFGVHVRIRISSSDQPSKYACPDSSGSSSSFLAYLEGYIAASWLESRWPLQDVSKNVSESAARRRIFRLVKSK